MTEFAAYMQAGGICATRKIGMKGSKLVKKYSDARLDL